MAPRAKKLQGHSLGITRSFPGDHKVLPSGSQGLPSTPKLHRSAADLCNLGVGGGVDLVIPRDGPCDPGGRTLPQGRSRPSPIGQHEFKLNWRSSEEQGSTATFQSPSSLPFPPHGRQDGGILGVLGAILKPGWHIWPQVGSHEAMLPNKITPRCPKYPSNHRF